VVKGKSKATGEIVAIK
jgi:serine/threonine protein kinase